MLAAYAYCASGAPAARPSAFTALRGPLRRPRAAPVPARRRTCPRSILGGSVPTPSDSDEEASNELDKVEVELYRAGAGEGGVAGGELIEMPLFPLQVVLNPGCVIPLYIFEMRYRLLFNRIHDGEERRFGVVMYDKESDGLARVGCAAELVRFEPLPDGRIMTRNVGRERFRIVRILEEKPYMRAQVQYISDDAPPADCAELERSVWALLQDVLALSNKLYEKAFDMSAEIRRTAPPANATGGGPEEDARMQDFSFAVNQILDMPLREQQVLLQITDTARRLRRQNSMLRTARNYLAAQVTIKNAF